MAKPNQIDERQPSTTLTSHQPGGIPGCNTDIPLIRISTCGPFTVEVLDTLPEGNLALARYTTLSRQLIHEHDGRALPLLRLFCNAEGRFVSKDTLLTLLCQERKACITEKTLQNIISSLRDLLALPGGQKIPYLIVHVRATRESGDGYCLAPFPLVWLDTDAITWNIEQATLKQRFHDDPFPYWQRAYQLARRGNYLIEEPFSDWAVMRRETVQDQLRLCVHALSRLLLSREGEAGEEEVTRLLLSYCRDYPQDEDTLRTLLELLCKRGRYQDVLSWYGRLETALHEAGLTKLGQVRTPHPSTAEIAAYAQLKRREVHLAEDRGSGDLSGLTPATQMTPLASSPAHTQPLPTSSTLVLSEPYEQIDTSVSKGSLAPSHEDKTPQAGAFDHFDAFTGPLHAETRHLIGRGTWLSHILQMVQTPMPKKLIVLHGPIGIGKSSELKRLAEQLHHLSQDSIHVLTPLLFEVEQHSDPEAALDAFLGTILHECTSAPFPANASRPVLTNLTLAALEQQSRPLVILLDNAECLLTGQGQPAACWQTFLTRYLKSQHHVTLILATKEWQDWSGRENTWLAEIPVPPLSPAESVSLLQHLGLQEISAELLDAVGSYLSGIPLLLEWTATLVTNPHLFAYWEAVYGSKTGHPEATQTPINTTSERLQCLLASPSGLNLHLANKLAPMLHCLLEKHLSTAARLVLNRLAVATLPLGKAALQVLCSRLDLLQELRSASLLVAYTNRIQVLPVVAWTVQQDLTPEQRRLAEEVVIEAYRSWLHEGDLEMQEAGNVITELAVLLLTHQRLLEVAQLVVRYGWISLQLGHGPRLAFLAQETMETINWHQTVEYECAGLVLLKMLFPSQGKSIQTKDLVNYDYIRDALLIGKLVLHETTEGYIVHQVILNLMNGLRFTEAEAVLDAYRLQLEVRHVNPENSESWHQKRALLLGQWCDYLQETGETERAGTMREETIRLYQQRAQLLSPKPSHSPLKKQLRARALGSCFSFLGDHLNRIGQHKEALRIIDQAIVLQKQGLGNIGVLASSYSDKAQILIELGRFQEALLADEEAMIEIQRCINAEDAISRRDIWTYYVNRGRLYLRVGRVEEAKCLFQKACPRIHENRRIYRMFARDGLNEIEQWRQQSVTPHYQLDWRWIERYRKLCDYDNVWWLTWAGPFTEEEQAQWDGLSALPLDEATRTQLGMLMKGSRERELATALAEHCEPSLHYPAIDIAEVQRRIAANVQLKEEIHHQEPNVIVRRLYEGVIEEELDYLHLIEAAYERNSQKFHEYSLRVFPLPTPEEMRYALTHIERTLAQGLKRADTTDLSQQLLSFLQTDLGLSLDLTSDEEVCLQETQKSLSVQPQEQETPKVSAQAAKRFFEAVFRENGYEGWQVQIDLNATNARVEQGMRCLFLSDKTLSLSSVKDLFTHEVAGHVARCVAGERSLLGLLGIQTQNHAPTEEGYILYHQRQLATLREEPWNDSGMRLSTLSVGLAHGVMTPPQTFLVICSFIESFSMLRRLLKHPEIEREVHEKRARAFALNHCLRVFRGVPSLSQAGICYPQDAIYLHGLFMIEQAVALDKTVLDRLAVGKVALELLPDLQELGITTSSLPSLYARASDPDLDASILSFEDSGEASSDRGE